MSNWKPKPPLVPLGIKRRAPIASWLIISVMGLIVGWVIAYLWFGGRL